VNLSLRRRPAELERDDAPALGFQDWVDLVAGAFSFNGVQYTFAGASQEEIGANFAGLARSSYQRNGVVFACMGVRMRLFSEARFQFRQRRQGRPGQTFGTPDLAILETPWPNGTTGDLLTKMIQHADIGGNAFVARRRSMLKVLRPDWVDIIVGSDSVDDVASWDVDSEVLGYVYYPGGKTSGRPKVFFLAEEVAHFAPIPDPLAEFRGMSWLTPIIREVMADKAATDHKLGYFERGGTPNMTVKFNTEDLEKWKGFIEKFRESHEGAHNSYRTLFLNSAMDATVVGSDLKQLDFKVTQGAGETRIAAAAGVPPIIVGLSEGLEAATYSNYGQARRALSDGTMRPLWRNAAGSLATIVNVPPAAELWYDASDVAFLQEDEKDAAEIQGMNAVSVRQLVDAGFEPDSVVAAIDAGDFTLLTHTGLFSVQLQPPGTSAPAAPATQEA
jgi:phage portal protein BeeE